MGGVSRIQRSRIAGYWYPGTPESLRESLRALTDPAMTRRQALGVMVPHAAFQFSGSVAGATFSRVEIPTTCLILGPTHTGSGEPWSLMAEGSYQTPLGEVAVDERTASALLDACPLLSPDTVAHQGEHAIEVELPFLQWLGPENLRVVPLVIGSREPAEFEIVADALARVIRQRPGPVLVIVSSDLSHYEPHQATTEKDARLIHAIRSLSARQFLDGVEALRASVCGDGPIACALEVLRQLGSSQAALVQYATSADAGGDPDSAVGYAGIMFN